MGGGGGRGSTESRLGGQRWGEDDAGGSWGRGSGEDETPKMGKRVDSTVEKTAGVVVVEEEASGVGAAPASVTSMGGGSGGGTLEGHTGSGMAPTRQRRLACMVGEG